MMLTGSLVQEGLHDKRCREFWPFTLADKTADIPEKQTVSEKNNLQIKVSYIYPSPEISLAPERT